MKKIVLLSFLVIPAITYAQRKSVDNVYGDVQTWQKRKPNPAYKIGTGGGLLAAGTALTAGAAIYSLNITKNEEKTVVYVGAGVGAAFAIIGGIMIGQGAKDISKRLSVSGMKFTGSSIVYRF
ncbi:hypothetical protein [Chitinophaga cymbidii]|uniref:Uncharacterized protein n=1 Tax=Chitinophaga cymbidii TaxID=1096750 RepID=A0A512RIK6_9BACT|nr:hypothetical protein [Chitinophaga cymbidii]GEP95536.1 hypothetical protein CCY01nite_17960 [Chitinophaga cymbidii]